MSFFRAISPRAAWADIVEIWRSEQRYKIHFMAASLFCSLLIFTAFFFESGFEVEPKPNKIIYVESWTDDRSDEEIMAQRKALMEEIAERKKLRAARQKEIQDSYRRLGERLGMDMDDPRYEGAAQDSGGGASDTPSQSGQAAAE